MTTPAAVFAQLVRRRGGGPAVVAHRGDSAHLPENTLPAFASALRLGVPMQEFDVRATRDGVLVCLHDATLDRTTDAAARLGPGALVAAATWAEVQQLDAGAWRGVADGPVRVPSLAEVLALLGPDCIAMIEHKAGEPESYVAELRRSAALARSIVQSFDWSFVAAARRLEPALACALLGPTSTHRRLDPQAIDAARDVGAGMLHWLAGDVTREAVVACHDAGLLLCTYTTDDDLGLCGGAALGVDAMCTNRPGRMIELATLGYRAPLA